MGKKFLVSSLTSTISFKVQQINVWQYFYIRKLVIAKKYIMVGGLKNINNINITLKLYCYCLN